MFTPCMMQKRTHDIWMYTHLTCIGMIIIIVQIEPQKVPVHANDFQIPRRRIWKLYKVPVNLYTSEVMSGESQIENGYKLQIKRRTNNTQHCSVFMHHQLTSLLTCQRRRFPNSISTGLGWSSKVDVNWIAVASARTFVLTLNISQSLHNDGKC